jgi:chromosome partitioning protein
VINGVATANDVAVPAGKVSGLWLLSSDLDLAGVEIEAPRVTLWQTKLADVLQNAETTWDMVISDTPPGLGVLSTMALNAADGALVVCPPDYLAYRSLAHLEEMLTFSNTPLIGIVLTMVSNQSRHAREALELMEENYKDLILPSIPKRVVLQDAMVAGQPIIDYQPNGDSAKAFLSLAKEVLHRATTIAA